MFGQNVGVMMSYMKTASLLQRGAHVYASRKARFIDVIPTEDYSEDIPEAVFIGTDTEEYTEPTMELSSDLSTDVDEVLKAADEFLEAAEFTPKQGVIPIQPLGNYDFASLYGLGAVASEPEIEEPVKIEESVKAKPEPIIIPEVQPAVTVKQTVVAPSEPVVQTSPQPKAPTLPKAQTPVTQPATQVAQSRPIQSPTTQQPDEASAPDISGMNLKTQALTIARWYGKTIMQEEVLFGAFGKSTILKLVSEGYLVKTKKGILLGS